MTKRELSQPLYSTRVEGKDILAPKRDGARLAVDVYRPDAEGRFPALFRRDHRICVNITALDIPTGVAGDSAVEYIPYHLCSSKTVVHKIYRCQKYPSHLLLRIIPNERG